MTNAAMTWGLLLVPLVAFLGMLEVEGFVATSPRISTPILNLQQQQQQQLSPLYRPVHLWAKRRRDESEDDEEEEDDDDELDLLPESDWRDFRAKLVMSETQGTTPSTFSSPLANATDAVILDDNADDNDEDEIADLDGIGSIFLDASRLPSGKGDTKSSVAAAAAARPKMTPLDPKQWAYESGKVIEQGAVILGGVEQAFGFGLRQQYFHKAAILVLDHEDSTFTKGIILNRPTDLTLDDDINPGVRWRVWFGGDVQGLNSDKPDIVCLHSLKNEQATKASIKVMKDIKWTTFENAKRLVQVGAAQPTDFWVFMGYAGWGAGQLMGELDRKSWYMVATDSRTLLKELARQSAASDPREAGLDTWTLLMEMIGRGDLAKESTGDFDDLMLKEWALENLLSSDAGGGAGDRDLSSGVAERGNKRLGPPFSMGRGNDPLFGRFMNRMAPRPSEADMVKEGSVVRASPADRSPFLLNGQEFHKSVVLILSDEKGITVGAILNRPASKGLDVQIRDKGTGEKKKVMIPLRFGGQYTVKGSEALLWLHCSAKLRDAEVGAPVGPGCEDGIWKCTADDVINSIGRQLATPEDFIVVSGVSIWGTTPGKSTSRGIQEEVDKGKFEVVPEKNVKAVWNALSKQAVLTADNLSLNLEVAAEAWDAGGGGRSGRPTTNGSMKMGKPGESRNGRTNGRLNFLQQDMLPMKGLGDGFDEEDDTLVFKSDVKVAELSDNALRSWVQTFLLGMSSMKG